MNEENNPRDFKYYLLLFQATVCVLLICAALTVKFIGGGFYKDVRGWYMEKFCVETSLKEIIGNDSDGSDFESTGYTVYQ